MLFKINQGKNKKLFFVLCPLKELKEGRLHTEINSILIAVFTSTEGGLRETSKLELYDNGKINMQHNCQVVDNSTH